MEERSDEQFRIQIGSATHAGGRDQNQDALYVGPLPALTAAGDLERDREGWLLLVADGMGGYQHGEVASRLAIDTVSRTFQDQAGPDTALVLKQAFRRANQAIFQQGANDSGEGSMGTTLVVAAIRGKYATIANVGDSRAYLVRANRLTQITRDHSLVAEQVARGAMPAEQARLSPQRNILTQALGSRDKLDTKMPNVFELVLLPEDRLLLCTDGFYDVVSDDDLQSVVLSHDAEAAADELVKLAVERGTSDNVTAIVAEMIPTRVVAVREPQAAGESYVIPVLVAVAAIILIAIVVLILMRV